MGAMSSACPLGQAHREFPADPTEIVEPVSASADGLILDVAPLLYDATLWRHWLLQLVSRLGVTADYASFCGLWDRQYRADVNCGRREYTEALEAFLRSWGLTWAQVDEVEAASRARRVSFELDVRPLPGVVRTIHRLARLPVPLVAWADAPQPAAHLLQSLDRMGLVACFATVLSSFDLECSQPAPACYRQALDVLGLSACDALYVGHDPQGLAGAKALGLRTVAFDVPHAAEVDFCLARFEDLLPLLAPKALARPALRMRAECSRVALADPAGSRP